MKPHPGGSCSLHTPAIPDPAGRDLEAGWDPCTLCRSGAVAKSRALERVFVSWGCTTGDHRLGASNSRPLHCHGLEAPGPKSRCGQNRLEVLGEPPFPRPASGGDFLARGPIAPTSLHLHVASPFSLCFASYKDIGHRIWGPPRESGRISSREP